MKKKKNWFIKIINILFIIYLVLFILSKNGFYEAKVKKDTILTNEQIKKFEKDVNDGKVIDINNYFSKSEVNYNNKFNETGEKLESKFIDMFSHGFKKVWKVIKVLFITIYN